MYKNAEFLRESAGNGVHSLFVVKVIPDGYKPSGNSADKGFGWITNLREGRPTSSTKSAYDAGISTHAPA